jgi:hypothetical protein
LARIPDLEVVLMAVRARRFLTLTAVLLVMGAVLAPSSLASRRDTAPPPAFPTIYVVYTMNCTFSIIDDFGKRLNSIPPGTYQIEVSTPVMFKLVRPGGVGVDDIAPNDFTGCKGWVQFQLTGPGVDLFTTLDSGCDAFLLLPAQTFKANSSYVFQDLNQPAVTRTSLPVEGDGKAWNPINPYTVTSGKGHASTDPVGAGRTPLEGRLAASLTAAGAVTLTTNKGKPFVSLKPGRYQFVIRDRSSKQGFVIEPVDGKPKTLTGTKFVGTSKKGVILKSGRWMYSAGSGKTYYFLVSQ